jgi:TRAP-type uncharacterized transport system substrate-binding protein
MEPLPKGANFKRAKVLWELGLHIAGDPSIKYGGNRDMSIVVGSGGGDSFIPSLKLATGSAIMALAVAKGEVDMAFVNPSAMLTQAYRGQGIFDTPLPLRVIGSYPSFDRFVIAIRKSLGFKSLYDIKKAKYPLKMSLREDPTHSTIALINQLLAHHGMSIAEIESWGGKVHPCGGPGDARRTNAVVDGTLDAVFDEGVSTWLRVALANGMVPLDLDAEALAHLGKIGWRHGPLRMNRFDFFPEGHSCIDFSGWPLYTRASLPDKVAYEVAQAFGARHDEMPWEEGTHEGIAQIAGGTDATPTDVPLHPGAERWYREQGLLK